MQLRFRPSQLAALAFVPLLLACQSTGWYPEQKEAFVANCMKSSLQQGFSEEDAQEYCQCMQQRIEAEFPSSNKLGDIVPEDIKRNGDSCAYQILGPELSYQQDFKDVFHSECRKMAVAQKKDEPEAWCSCVLQTILAGHQRQKQLEALTQDSILAIGRACEAGL